MDGLFFVGALIAVGIIIIMTIAKEARLKESGASQANATRTSSLQKPRAQKFKDQKVRP